jgi:hypothetical protein
MSWLLLSRQMAAAAKREEREAKKRQRELERQAKEASKLSAQEQARLEVEAYECEVDVLLSVHKESSEVCDWAALAASLPPVPPRRGSHCTSKARQRLMVFPLPQEMDDIKQAQQQDEREFQEAEKGHAIEYAEWKKLRDLANRVLSGDKDAYNEAILELDPFGELARIGSSVQARVHSTRVVECSLSTKGRKAIPTEAKSLTAAGKLSVKPMSKQRFVEICQDYVCSCVLRLARELFALLPVETLLITAAAGSLDTATGRESEHPFLSLIISRGALNALNFDKLDPSDTVLSLKHRGDLKASRKTGDFGVIDPFTDSDIAHEPTQSTDAPSALSSARLLREEMAAECAALAPKTEDGLSADGDT